MALVAGAASVALGLAACSSDDVEPGATAASSSGAASDQLNIAPIAKLETTAITATADTWVAAAQSAKNFGSRNFIALRSSRESGLLRFNVPQLPGWRITSATLKLNSGNVGGTGVSVYSTTGTWSESRVTWRSAPAGGSLLATGGSYRNASWASWDVLAAVPPAGGMVNLRVENHSRTWMGFLSRETGAATAPQLVITRTVDTSAVPSSTPSANLPTWTPPPGTEASGPSSAASDPRPSKSSAAKPPTSTTSGGSIPAAAGWTKVYQDDFTGSALGTGWGKYSGAIPSTPGGTWSGSMVEVADGKLKLHTEKVNGAWNSGGVMNDVGGKTTYGKYLVRFRMDKANGVKYALLLWPTSGQWPMDGEIDFAEDGGGSRKSTAGTLHWGTTASHQQLQRNAKADFSKWHTVGVEWTPGKVVFTLDGKPYGTIKNSNAPTKPMNLALQTEAGSCGQWMTCTDSTTPSTTTLEVDWVAVYTKN